VDVQPAATQNFPPLDDSVLLDDVPVDISINLTKLWVLDWQYRLKIHARVPGIHCKQLYQLASRHSCDVTSGLAVYFENSYRWDKTDFRI